MSGPNILIFCFIVLNVASSLDDRRIVLPCLAPMTFLVSVV